MNTHTNLAFFGTSTFNISAFLTSVASDLEVGLRIAVLISSIVLTLCHIRVASRRIKYREPKRFKSHLPFVIGALFCVSTLCGCCTQEIKVGIFLGSRGSSLPPQVSPALHSTCARVAPTPSHTPGTRAVQCVTWQGLFRTLSQDPSLLLACGVVASNPLTTKGGCSGFETPSHRPKSGARGADRSHAVAWGFVGAVRGIVTFGPYHAVSA